ncbi:unnamed protein product, partial [Adineta ricciae]
MSPSPSISRKRQIETNQQQQYSSLMTQSMNQQSAFITPTRSDNKRPRPSQSHSLTRSGDYRCVRQYPKSLEIFIPFDNNDQSKTTMRTYEYEIEKKRRSSSENLFKQRQRDNFHVEQQYLRCLDDLTDEYVKLKRRRKSVDQRKESTTCETTEQYETIERAYRQPRPTTITSRDHFDNTYQRSASENLLQKRFQPLTTTDLTLSDDDFSRIDYNLSRKERSKPIHIHSSTGSIPGEMSIKYVRTEPLPVEVLVPKSQLITTHGEHSSTVLKDTRQATRRTTTNIHQQPRRRTIEGQHELRIIEQPITSGQTLPVEFTVPKPIETLPAEHSSTFVVKSRKGGRFQTVDISQTLGRERRLSGEHELRIISEPIRPSSQNKPVELLFPKPALTSQTSHHSSTIVKQNRRPQSSYVVDNIQTVLKGEHELRLVDKPIQSGPGASVELIVPKSMTDTVEHTSTVITETHPQRRVLEITGSGRKIENEHETKYFHDKVRVEEVLEVKLPKTKYNQAEHSSTVIKRSRGRAPVMEIDTQQRSIEGEHELRVLEESIQTTADTMELLVPKHRSSSEHSTTLIKRQPGKPQTFTIDRRQTISGDHVTKYYDQPVETYSPMEVVFPKPHSSLNTKEVEHTTTYLRKARPKFEPVELVVDRPKVLPSVSKIIADIPATSQITSMKSTTFDTNVTERNFHERYDQMEDVYERPLLRDSSTTVLANIQPGLELKSIQPTRQQTKTTRTEESTSTYTMERDRYPNEEILELRLRKPYIEDSSSTVLASVQPELGIWGLLKPSPYVPQTLEESSSMTLMDFNTSQQTAPYELIIPRFDVESSTSTVLAQVAPAPAGSRTKVDVSKLEKSTSSVTFEQTTRSEQEVEMIMPKPKRIDTSTSTMLADVHGKYETKQVRPSEFQPGMSTSSVLFDQTTRSVLPQSIELHLRQPSSTQTQYETITEQYRQLEDEINYTRPLLQESTSVIPSSFQSPLKPSSQTIVEHDKLDETIVESHIHRQTSSHATVTDTTDRHVENDEMYVLGSGHQQMQSYGSPAIHADLNKPLELVFNVDGGTTTTVSPQYRRGHNSRILSNSPLGRDNNSTVMTETVTRQYQPIEFRVSGGLPGYNNNIIEQYSTVGSDSPSGYTTTKTTTTRTITSSDTPGRYGETISRSTVRGIKPFDQVDLILQPDTPLTSTTSRLLTTSTGYEQGYTPYFTVSLNDQTVREGESVLLEIKVSAQPAPEIIWDKDGQLIGDDSSFRLDYYGDGRATLYIPEAFTEDQGLYTCTVTNGYGTCRTSARLTVDSTGGGPSPKRRQLDSSTNVLYRQGPTQTIESYRVYSKPSSTITQVTEETQVYQIPSHQQNNEITYSIHGTQPKFQPISFLVSSNQETTQPNIKTTYTTEEDNQAIYSNAYRTQPNRQTGLVATVAKQAGPTLTQEYDTMETSYMTSRPNFTKPLESIDALEGGTVQITVHLSSVGPYQTRPQIQWYHHAQPIQPDNQHYRITEGYDTATLEIINVKKHDTGQVWCVANTPSGSATTTCTLTVEERPVRTHHHHVKSTQQYTIPQETVYETQSTHSSHAQIPLHHQQQPEQRTLSQYYTNQTVTEQQYSPQSYTSQTPLSYQQQVSPQSLTSQQSYSTVSYQQQQPQQQAPFQPYTSQPQSVAPQQAPFQPYTSQPQAVAPQQPQQPQSAPQAFIPPAPPLLPNFNTKSTYADKQIKVLDNGLQDQPLYTGGETVFECQFTGQPDKVQWFRNEVEIVNNPQQLNNRIYHVTNLNSGITRLIIKTTLDEDVGTYTVKLSGPNEETTSAKLVPAAQFQNIQKKKVEQTQRKALVQELEERQLKRMRPTKPAPRSGYMSYGTSDDDVFYEPTQRVAPQRHPTAPTLSRPLKDQDVKEGQPIQLTCQVQGFPKSELLWFKNNVPLPLSARHKIAYDANNGTITLRVTDSRPEDSGVYTVIAKNPQGYVETTAHVIVEESPGIDETSYVQPDAFKYLEKQPVGTRQPKRRESDTSTSQPRPAKITKTPTSSAVVEGETAQFTCQVDGNPKPKVAWLKDSKPLMAGPRFSTYYDQATKTAVLRVKDVCKEDQGYYTCVVDNSMNSDRSTATLQVVPETKVDQRSYVETDAFKYLTPENKQLRTANRSTDRVTSGVDSESFVNPDSFRYLETKKQPKQPDDNLAIDDRPIVDLDAFRYVEARQAPKMKREDTTRASIDDTPIIAPDAFRYLERKADATKLKKDQDTGPSIDETPQVNLAAFQYLERKGLPKKPEEGPSIDESSIVNPEAFKYLERKPLKKTEDVGPAIDETPIVNPDAFKYLERKVAPQPRDTTPAIDTTPLVNPEVFKYLEKPTTAPRIDETPVIDTRPIVPQEAFRWLDRPKQLERIPEGPAVDESSYVNPQAFRYIEAKPKEKPVDTGPSVDQSSYVNPQAFRYLEAAPTKKPVDQGPVIDTSNYVNPQLFAQFEMKPAPQSVYEEQEIKRAPRVLQPLKSTQAIEGKPAVLVANIDGFPVPQLTWLKDGAELPASNRVTTNYDIPSKTAWIRIDNVRPDDSSVYTLIAHNSTGEVRSDARLNVMPSMTPIDNTAFVPAEAFERIERGTGPARPTVPATTGVDDTSFVNPLLFQQFEAPLKTKITEDYSNEVVVQVPARFLTPLKSVQAPESTTVVFEAIVEGSPIPTFTWLKDQLPLGESNRFVTNYDLPSKRVTLTIKDVRESDTGTYTVLASNGPQLQHSSVTIQIVGAPSIDQSSFIPMDVFNKLEKPFSQQPYVLVQSGVDQTSYISQPDRFAVFDQIQPNRRPLNDFGGVDETPLVNMEKIRLLEIPSSILKQPYDVEEKSEAPTVISPLQPVEAQEGTPVVLTAKITGSPMPNFTWSKDNAPLLASSRFTTYYDIPSKLIVLQINDARPNDTGVYTVHADNKSGDTTSSATLTISSQPGVRDQSFITADKFRLLEQPNQPRTTEDISGVDERPLVDLTKIQQLEIKPAQLTVEEEEEQTEQVKPTVLIPLRNIKAVENQPVVLSAQIEGKPQPQFSWFKNDQPLPEGNRFRTHYDIPSKTIFLTVAGAREDDSGTYRLVAQNPTGQEETTCEVTVDINQPNIDQRSFVPQKAFDKLEKPLLQVNSIISGVDQTSFFNQELFRPLDERHIKHPSAIVGGEESDAAMPVSAPKVLTPLRPTKTTEGETVLLSAQIEGYPLPQFTWMHNNQPLMASNRVTSHYDMLTKRCFLQIVDSRPSDVGTYELLAENPSGQDRTRTELIIVPVSKIDQTGYVPFEKFSTLESKPRIPSDLRSGVDASPFVSGEIFRLLEAKPVNEYLVPEEEGSVPVEVLVPLKPAIAQEGQPVILTAKIRGRPTPQFTWLRNNQPVLESNRLQTYYDFPSETLVLEISDIWPHDAGNYTVIAENPKTGERVETSAPLTVRGDATSIDRTAFVAPDAFRTLETVAPLRPVVDESGVDTNSYLSPDVLRALDQAKQKPNEAPEKKQPLVAPKVLAPLQPIKCNEGQPINFTAKVEGVPQPHFVWLKNGQPLPESNRVWSHYDLPTKTLLLQINGARPDDTGSYVLKAENPLGHDETQTTVNVLPGPAVDTNAFVPPEKFAAFDQPFGPNVPTQSGVDNSPFVQPERFAPLEVKAPQPTKQEMQKPEAPKVLSPLQPTKANEGSPVLLQASIVGTPTPNFTWLKDGKPLQASNRLRTRYDIGTKQVLLQIHDVRPQDAGQYTVVASNPAGEQTTVSTLDVVPDQSGVDERPFVPADKFRNLEQPQADKKRPLEILSGIDIPSNVSPMDTTEQDLLPEEKRAPRVTVPLKDNDTKETMPVIFSTTIEPGSPMSKFTWLKNGQPLVAGDRFITKYDVVPKTLTLEILNVRPEDQGTYTVRATNPTGTDETTAKLTVKPLTNTDAQSFAQPKPLQVTAPQPTQQDMQQPQPPNVVKPLENVQAPKGSPVLLRATIAGKPAPTFTWFKDKKPLQASPRYRTQYDVPTKQVVLQIDEARPEDAGQYAVVAANPVGQETTVGSLTVVPERTGEDNRPSGQPQGKSPRPVEMAPGVDYQPTDVSPVAPAENRAPRVLVPLKDSETKETMPTIFSTTIEAGSPSAKFTWLKNGQPLVAGDRFITKYDVVPKTLTLEILNVRPEDQGTYTVRATNPTGTDETTAKLTVKPLTNTDAQSFAQPRPLQVTAPQPTQQDMQQPQPPKVVKPLENIEAPKGSPVLLRATIAGKPTPTFTWFKDKKPLQASPRYRTQYDVPTKQVVLQIDEVRPEDAGQYAVVAANPVGQETTVGSLTVVPERTGEEKRPLGQPQGKAPRPVEVTPGVDFQPMDTRPLALEENRAPRVMVPLKDGDTKESMPIVLTATVDAGSPMSTLTWFKNGQPLVAGDRFITKYDVVPKILTLEILNARPEDQGTYTVQAKNPLGADETSAKVTVRPLTNTDAQEFAQPKPLQVTASQPTPQDMKQPQPPKIVKPLENIEAPKGSPILFRATITGKPTPTFTWFKDNKPLQASPRYRTQYDIPTNQVLLQIDEVRPDDLGKYAVVAANPVGQETSAAMLTIVPESTGEEKPLSGQPPSRTPRPVEMTPGVDFEPMDTTPLQPQETRAPRVIVPLKDRETKETMPAIFSTTIDLGSPNAKFTWFKNGQPLVAGDRFITKYDVVPKILTLEILDVHPEDQGTYTIRATNPVGTDETTAKLIVKPLTNTDVQAFTQPKPLEVTAPQPSREDMQQPQPPKVVKPLENIQTPKGSPVLLRATIAGKPTPTFTWFKDKKPLQASPRYRTQYDVPTKQVVLQIDEVRPEDAGQYTVVATNPAGRDTTTSSLTVIPERTGEDNRPSGQPQNKSPRPVEMAPGVDYQPTDVSPLAPEDNRAPRVLVPLENKETKETMPVIFTTTIDTGSPTATFTWFKNGQPLIAGDRFITKYDVIPKRLTLEILNARPEDQGTYTVQATNPLGTDETTGRLTVKPLTNTDAQEFAQPKPLEVTAPKPSQQDIQQPQPPKVIVPLEDAEISKGSPVLLRTTITGKPTPKFTWFKDNKPLQASPRYRTQYDAPTNQVVLQIDEARPEDVGQYIVVATNPVGEDTTGGKLKLIPEKGGEDTSNIVPMDKKRGLGKPQGKAPRPVEMVPGLDFPPGTSSPAGPEENRPPRVMIPLTEADVKETMPALLTAVVDAGSPVATFTWFKNGQPLIAGDRFISKYDVIPKTATLEILDARPEDQGTYTLRAANPIGTDETTANLTVKPLTNIDAQQFAQPKPLQVTAPQPTQQDLQQPQPPKVIIPIEDAEAIQGSPALLRATVTGKPTPTFAWFKDNKPLQASPRLRTRYDAPTNQVVLQINDVQPEDVGQYLVLATNPAGEDSTGGKVNLILEKSGEDTSDTTPTGLGQPQGKTPRPLDAVPGLDYKPDSPAPEQSQPPRMIL